MYVAMCTMGTTEARRAGEHPVPPGTSSAVEGRGDSLPLLPESFREQFWEVEFRPDLTRTHPEYVVARLLEHGGDAAIHWILRNLPCDLLARVVRERRGLRRATAYCWANYLGIPVEEIACLNKPSLLPNSSFA